VPADVLLPIKLARNHASDILATAKPKCYNDLIEAFEKGKDALIALHPNMRSELHMVENGQGYVDQELRRQSLGLLPATRGRKITLAQAQMNLQQLYDAEAGAFASRTARDQLEIAVEVISGMQDGISLEERLLRSEGFLKEV
jgi:hypothetical protein